MTLLFITILSSCYTPERDCINYKTGNFEFEYEIDGIIKKATFKRTAEYSIDYVENEIDTSKVRWINDCEFVLTPLEQTKAAIHYKILSTTKDSYIFEYKRAAKQSHKKQIVNRGTAKKID